MPLPQPKPPAAFRKQVFSLLGENYGDKTLVLCPTVFVRLLHGDHKAAILLSQILYWGDKTKDPDGWFYKSMSDWKAETGLSEAQVRRILNGDPRVKSPQITLRDLGVETLLKKVKRTGAPTLHYRINRERFLAALAAFLGQGDSSQCAGSTPDIAQDQSSPESGVNTDQCAPSSDKPETSQQEISAEDHNPSNPAHHPDDDSDLAVFLSYESRFGRLKNQFKEPLRAELTRLGATKVREVLDRCVGRGRSWAYVLKALANEAPAAALVQDASAATRWGGLLALDSDEGLDSQEPGEAPVAVSERLQTPWHGFDSNGTVQDVWSAAYHQLEAQLDRSTFETALRGAALVDFDPVAHTFVVVVRNSYARDMLQYRLDRMVKRVAGDVYGQPVEVKFLLGGEWGEPQPVEEKSA